MNYPIEEKELDLFSGDLLHYRRETPVFPESGNHPVWGKVLRISPKSFREGFQVGTMYGFVMGFVACMMLASLIMACQ